MRRAVAAVARTLGVVEHLPQWLVRPAASADAQLAEALEELARFEAQGRARQKVSAVSATAGDGAGHSPASPLQATADALGKGSAAGSAHAPTKTSGSTPADVAADLAKPDAELDASVSGKRLAELGRMLYTGEGGVGVDIHRATRLWIRGAKKGDVYCMHQVSLGLVDGMGIIPKNRALAERGLAELVTKTQSGLAAFGLAGLLLRGRLEAAGVQYDPALPDITRIPEADRMHSDCVRAFHALDSASVASVPPAWLNLAHCYQHGIGTKKDEQQANKWLRHAAARGDVLAAVELAARLAQQASANPLKLHSSPTKGSSAPQAASKADPLQVLASAQARWESLRLWRQAAEAGHPVAMHNLGVAYLEGYGAWLDAPQPVMKGGQPVVPGPGQPVVPGSGQGQGGQDAPAALVWFRRAASAGFLRSMLNLASLLERGSSPAATSPPGATTATNPSASVPAGTAVVADLPAALTWYEKALGDIQKGLDKAQAEVNAAKEEGEEGPGMQAAAARLQHFQRLHSAVSAQLSKATARARQATEGGGQVTPEVAEGEGAELRLDFSSVDARDEAYKALTSSSSSSPGNAVGSLTGVGLLHFLHAATAAGAVKPAPEAAQQTKSGDGAKDDKTAKQSAAGPPSPKKPTMQ